MTSVDLPFVNIRFLSPVIHLVFKEGAALDTPEMRQIIRSCAQLTGNTPYVIFSDVRVFLTITPEARQLAADPKENALLKANAVLVGSLPLKLLANFFATFNKPPYAYRVFNHRENAFEWLNEQVAASL